MSNQTKVWKTKTRALQDGKAWSRDPKSALFEIYKVRNTFTNFGTLAFLNSEVL